MSKHEFGEWKPIETVDISERILLLWQFWSYKEVVIGYFSPRLGKFVHDTDEGGDDDNGPGPTHWMPLPPIDMEGNKE